MVPALLMVLMLVFCPPALAGEAEAQHQHMDHMAGQATDSTAGQPMAGMAPQPGAQPPAAPVPQAAASAPADQKVGVEEHLGDLIPEEITLRDEQGAPVRLRQLISMPTLLVPVYYTCPNDCNILAMSLARVLPQVGLKPGKDFQVISFSFDENDTPEIARQRRTDFTTALAGGFPAQDWRFLTGDREQIRQLTQAIGFHFLRLGKVFKHSVVMVAVSPQGKITRYLYGSIPLPFDIAMAMTEAAQGTPGLSISRAVAFCYSYDPEGRRYVFNIVKVAGMAVLAGMALFVLFLVLGGRKRRKA